MKWFRSVKCELHCACIPLTIITIMLNIIIMISIIIQIIISVIIANEPSERRRSDGEAAAE